MIRLSKQSIVNRETKSISHCPGAVLFRKEKKALFSLRTNDLLMMLRVLSKMIGDLSGSSDSIENLSEPDLIDTPTLPGNEVSEYDVNQAELLKPVLEDFDELLCFPAGDNLEALVQEKRLLLNEKPEQKDRIRLSRNYPYLAIGFEEPPFISLKEDTVENLLFIGPFTDRFFLRSAIDCFNELLHTPVCPGDDYPCHLIDMERCAGYCLGRKREEWREKAERYLLNVNERFLEDLRKKRDLLNDELSFTEAHNLNRMIGIIERYYRYLLFFSVIKRFEGRYEIKGVEYGIKMGLLEMRREGNISETFSGINNYFDDYEEREKYAVPKENLGEMWTLYEEIRKYYPEKIDEKLKT